MALSRKHCTLHLFYNCEKGQIWPAGCTLWTTGLELHSLQKAVYAAVEHVNLWGECIVRIKFCQVMQNTVDFKSTIILTAK